MNVLTDLFDEYADRFQKIPMLPLLYCGHFMMVTLGLRKRIGATFAQTNPLACWFSTVVANFSGLILINSLLGKPLILLFEDPNKILVITVIWYFAFFFPKNFFTRFFISEPLWVVIIILKEAHRTRGILDGVYLGMKLYPDSMVIVVILGFLKGAAGLLADPIAAAIRGSSSFANNEALKPSFVTKISVFISIIFTCSLKGMILTNIPISHLCLGSFIILASTRVLLYLSGWRDPFVPFENAVSPVCFGCPSESHDTKSKKD
ncbi:trimeric intracellular cation channel type 1B.1 [Exaiptasia diaphana]|uniref:Uncharacterized protein n=1 Tax=Exaiptasia diaphana TaxID=2652724 RepID=A0A913XLW0_EXADI|nr:trimeric intracellular cation channel type 1B.1 [Exaiptasia diaphana]KXJ10730.1 Trimeric intracellular cation channel type B [Exaiptasia diaphana]